MTSKRRTMTNKEGKRLYTKPEITKVRLVAGEAVLANCKNGTYSACVPPDASCTVSTSVS